MNPASTKSVAVLFHRVGPYHFARLQAAGQALQTTVIELSGSDNTYAWDPVAGAQGFKRVTVFKGDSQSEAPEEIARRVAAALDDCRPNAVAVNGWSDPAALSALAWCSKSKTPTIMMSESTAWDERRLFWKEWIKRRVLKLCSAALAGGTVHADYLEALGAPRNRIFLGYDAVDNDHFSAGAEQARSQALPLRSQRNLPDRYFLASARFVEKKNLSRLLQAYALYDANCQKTRSDPWSLVLLGDGSLKPDLCQLIRDLRLENKVHLPGFAQYPDLPIYYGLAGAFVHASTTEQWGLVVNEAMACGLPVLVSNRCGCARDLVQEGINGFTFDPLEIHTLAELMYRVASAPDLSSFQRASRQIIAAWGTKRFAEGLRNAVNCAVKAPPPRAAALDCALIKLLIKRRQS